MTLSRLVLVVAWIVYVAVGAAKAEDPQPAASAGMLRVGMIGLDTSHCIAFTKAMNDPAATGYLDKVEVVAAFPGGSPDVESSHSRVAGYTAEMRDMGVEIVGSVDELLPKVDVVLLESGDGRPHLEQARPVILAGKRLFIDKPLAGSLTDAVAIEKLAAEHSVPWFCSSSLRFSPGILGMRDDPRVGKVLGCDAYSPCSLEPHHPDLFWYGIHGVETLFTIMGPGCKSVARTQTADGELVVGVWEDGRIGTFRGIRAGKSGYGATVFGDKGIAPSGTYAGYQPLVERIAEFFHTGVAPVPAAETLEIYAFMEAADESKRQAGAPVEIKTVMEKAQAAAK